ncbi:MAG: diguanylate cyclase [Spirulina sp. SIO3F2]|nr:diguanylate cyclase [Spirulina sp. SIO3F2]
MKKTALKGILIIVTLFAFLATISLGQYLEKPLLHTLLELPKSKITAHLSEDEQRWLAAHSVIRVSNELDWAPFDFVEDGEPAGYCIDYFRLLESKLGIQFVFVTDTWANLLKRVKAKEIDVIHSIVETEERKQFLEFTEPFFSVTPGIVARLNDDEINKPEDATNRKLAVIDGYLFHEELSRKYPVKQQVQVASPMEALEAISSGRADVYYDSVGVINYWRNKQFITNLKVIAVENSDDDNFSDYHIAVRKDWQILRDILQKTMDTIGEHELMPLRKKWIGQPSANEIISSHSLAWKIFSVFLFVVLGILVWNFRLNATVKNFQKTRAMDEKTISDLEYISRIDGLTALFNRRHLDFILTMEWERHCHLGTKLSLIICDIDYFKQFNDTYGHQAGDDCLRQVAQVLKQETQADGGIAARYGGEEFVIVLPNTDSTAAIAIAQKLRGAISAKQIPHRSSLVKPIVSMSFGIATVYPNQSNNPDQIIGVADKALYQSKREGRDGVKLIDQS